MSTIAQQLGITKFPFEIKDENGNIIYVEYSDRSWIKRKFDAKGNEIYLENSNGYWIKQEYDQNNKLSYFEDANGFWYKREFDSKGNEIYYEDADGIIEDKRPKIELTLEDIAKLAGVSVEQIKIKK